MIKNIEPRAVARVPAPWNTPALPPGTETLQRSGEGLWRVIDERGTIRGHLRAVSDPQGVRYRAERMRRQQAGFRLVGEFWRADDAVAALRG